MAMADFMVLAHNSTEMLLDAEDIVKVVLFGGLAVVGVIAVSFGITANVVNTRARERTKRELAAYVAEGSITPADAERIIKADAESESDEDT